MTEEIAATPGWVDERLDELFASVPDTPEVVAARDAYSSCLQGRKQPGAPSDMLGAEFNGCRMALLRALQSEGISPQALSSQLEALEAEIADES